jgi:hypothetical protein
LGASGGTSDYLAGLLVVPATVNPGQVLLLDNATSITVFTGGIFSNAKEAKISQEFLQFITDVRFKDRYEKIGLEMVK